MADFEGSPLQVGDRLFAVIKSNRMNGPPSTRDVEVTKIGRRWVEIQAIGGHRPDRFDLETGKIDGGDQSSIGDVYRSESKWRDRQAAVAAFDELRRRIGYHANQGVTEGDVREAARLLKLELGE